MKTQTPITFTFLGTGTSQGVPIIGCTCAVCRSKDLKDKRLRASLLVNYGGENFVIDTGPDFRQQMLRENVSNIHSLVYTHEHKDHVAGMDDIRAINFLQKKAVPLFAHPRVQNTLQNEFPYAFAENKYPGVPEVYFENIQKNIPFVLHGLPWIPIEVMHYKLPVLGFRIGNFAYLTDCNAINEDQYAHLQNLDVLVISALRKTSHLSHFSLSEAIGEAKKIQAKQTYFTHISHQMGLHETVNKELPPSVHLAYDGLKIELNLDS